MRYASAHKQRTRERILVEAGRQFRKKGGEAVRVADVMQAAGLTIGGFYKHFADKDELFQEAVMGALEEVAARWSAAAGRVSRAEALRGVIREYLSEGHLEHPELGCALAAMGTEMARMPAAMKQAVSGALDAYAERLDFLMPGETAEERREGFLVLFPSMAGCLMTARAYASQERQRQVLEAGRKYFEKAFCGEEPGKSAEEVQ